MGTVGLSNLGADQGPTASTANSDKLNSGACLLPHLEVVQDARELDVKVSWACGWLQVLGCNSLGQTAGPLEESLRRNIGGPVDEEKDVGDRVRDLPTRLGVAQAAIRGAFCGL